ncbi:MAG: hypothetical protein KDA60_01585 [Planctomycetales bacterium]|nr:hypothetical protein [Planctomycetales bacterium]
MKPRLKMIIALAVMGLAIYPSLRLVESNSETGTNLSAATGLGQLLGSGGNRKSADGLLKRTRTALDDGNLELAEWYLKRVEQMDIDYSGIRTVTPQKLRVELEQRKADARLAAGNTAATPPNVAPMPSQRYEPQLVDANISETGFPALPVPAPDPSSIGALPNAEMIDRLAEVSPEAGLIHLQNARRAVAAGNLTAAVGYYHNAIATGASFAGQNDTPALVGQALLQAGVNPVDLAPRAAEEYDPAEAVKSLIAQPLPSLVEDEFVGAENDLEQARAQVLGLVAMARAALDREDIATAQRYITQAQSLQLPDSAFEPTDVRPDLVQLEIMRHKQNLGMTDPADIADTNFRALPPLTATQEAEIPPYVEAEIGQTGYDPIAVPPGQQAGLVNPDVVSAAGYRQPGTLPGQIAPTQFQQSLTPPTRSRTDAPTVVPLPAQLAQLPSAAQTVVNPTVSGVAPTQSLGPVGQEDPFADDDQLAPVISSPMIDAAAPTDIEDAYATTPQELPAGPPAFASPPASGSGGDAFGDYNDGLTALKTHDIPEARRLFARAWENRDQLDAETRQKLQNHLQDMSVPPRVAEDALADSATPLGDLTEEEQVELRQLVQEVSAEQAAVRRIREKRPTEAWERLKKLRTTVAEANIDRESQRRLLARIDIGINDLETYIEANRAMIELDDRNRSVLAEVKRRRETRLRTQQQVAEMVDEFNKLIEEQRFAEATVVAKKARELDPMNPVVDNLVWKAQQARQIYANVMRNENFHIRTLDALADVEDSAVPFPDSLVTSYPRNWEDLSNTRLKSQREGRSRYNEAEQQIDQALSKNVEVNFEAEPLYSAIDKLARMAGINVYLDPEGLEAEGVRPEDTVTLPLRKPVSLRSALNLILRPLHLSYIIQDEVLRITSEQEKEGDVVQRTYYVADLVLPIPNFSPNYNMGLPGAIRDGYHTAGYGFTAGALHQHPFTVAVNDQAAPPGAGQSALAQIGATGMIPGAANQGQSPLGFGPGGPGGGTQADFTTLTDLIEATVEPDTWEAQGGTGSMEGFPTNLSLVVSQTQEVHEKIADLLDQLRRLQDLQVTIEVRFIQLSDSFFERIGVDFDFDIDDNTGLGPNSVALLDDDGPSVTIGLDPITGSPTADLDLKFSNNTFGNTTPTFGGFTPGSGANIGFAILSDIEAFFLIEAVQGDSRTNILQAPKVTLFNGQQAFVSDTSQRPFVTSVIPVVGDFAAAQQPVITVLSEGTSLSVQAIVSNDRRFVRLTLVPFFSRIGDVDTFTFDGRTDSDSGTNAVDPTDDTNSVVDNQRTITQGTTVQLPTFAFTTVNTTVSVPDGGTILLGGIKRLSEGRTESGVPMLSKLPYINRLFRNVGIGRDTTSLMMMVTPRIIIHEEEEELQTGYVAPR